MAPWHQCTSLLYNQHATQLLWVSDGFEQCPQDDALVFSAASSAAQHSCETIRTPLQGARPIHLLVTVAVVMRANAGAWESISCNNFSTPLSTAHVVTCLE